MSPIAVHVVAGILFVGVGTTGAQESIPKPAVAEVRDTHVPFRLNYTDGIAGDVGVTVAIASIVHLDDPNDNVEGQNSERSPRGASDSPQAKRGTARRGFAGAMLRMLESIVGGLAHTGAR
jgi:hypothetical protein